MEIFWFGYGFLYICPCTYLFACIYKCQSLCTCVLTLFIFRSGRAMCQPLQVGGGLAWILVCKYKNLYIKIWHYVYKYTVISGNKLSMIANLVPIDRWNYFKRNCLAIKHRCVVWGVIGWNKALAVSKIVLRVTLAKKAIDLSPLALPMKPIHGTVAR